MNYINTQVIQVDNSIVEIPNQEFTKGAVINWSRTPYRQFKTSYEIREQNFEIVQEMIKNVRNKLIALPEVESVKRGMFRSYDFFTFY